MQLKCLYWLYFNKYKITTNLLLQRLSQAAAFLVTKVWFAAIPLDAVCYHKHKLSCLPDVLHVLPLVTHITPVR
jgi:alanine-alpha-ketoisovalerate/valine-pyruvate aminotransferase